MSNPLRDEIIRMVKGEIESERSTYPAYVVNYNHRNRTIDVKLSGIKHGQSTENGQYAEKNIQNVLILNSRAIKDEPPKPGDYVYLDFINNDMNNAIILTILRKSDLNTNNTGKEMEQSIISQSGNNGGW